MRDDSDYQTRYYNVDGQPALVAAKLVDRFFVAVLPSAVRAEGVETSEAEFDALVENVNRQGGKQHET